MAGRTTRAHHAQHAPGQHEWAVRAPVDGQERSGVVPSQDAERRLHEPAGGEFERPARNGERHERHEQGPAPQQAPQDCHARAAHAVQRRERAEQQALPVLPLVEHDDVEDVLDRQAHHAADHEHPEQLDDEGPAAAPGKMRAGCTRGSPSGRLMATGVQLSADMGSPCKVVVRAMTLWWDAYINGS